MAGNYEQDIISLALGNQLILQEIFRHVDGKDLRLVCKSWNEVMLTLPRPKLVFNLNHREVNSCCDLEDFTSLIAKMDAPLARKIFIFDRCWNEDHGGGVAVTATARKVEHFIPQFTEHIQIMMCEGHVPSVAKWLPYFQKFCPKLKELSIFEDDYDIGLQVFAEPDLIETSFELKPQLENLQVRGSSEKLVLFANKFARLCPNLVKLEVNYPMAPDLSHCKFIKELKYLVNMDEIYAQRRHLDLSDLTSCIVQVCDSLDKLELVVSVIDEYGVMPLGDSFNFELPRMANLTHLDIYNANIFHFSDALRDGRLRKLETLIIRDDTEIPEEFLEVRVEQVVQQLCERATQTNLKWLQIYGNCKPLIFENLRKPFPKLERLKFVSRAVQDEFCTYLNELKKLDLKHLDVAIRYPNKLSDFINALSDSGLLRTGIKTFRLRERGRHSENAMVDDLEIRNGHAQMERVLSYMKGLESIRISDVMFTAATSQRIVRYIDNFGLPIKFCGLVDSFPD